MHKNITLSVPCPEEMTVEQLIKVMIEAHPPWGDSRKKPTSNGWGRRGGGGDSAGSRSEESRSTDLKPRPCKGKRGGPGAGNGTDTIFPFTGSRKRRGQERKTIGFTEKNKHSD